MRATTPEGGYGALLVLSRRNQFMISIHTGAAPVMPLTFHMGSPDKLPAHTPTV
jgi:hypothetical protein